jgi:hypothetical protein
MSLGLILTRIRPGLLSLSITASTGRYGRRNINSTHEFKRSILEEFGMTESTPQDIPLSPSIDLDDRSSRKLTRDLHSKFRKIIGRLTYLAGRTRPDIQFTVNRLSQYLADPRDVHLRASKHLLRYIKGTITYGITYSAKGSDKTPVGYSDSSYGNATKYRSTSAYVFMMADGPVSWCSRKQPITAMSTTEVEYIAAAEVAKQVIWIRHFLAAIQKQSKDPSPRLRAAGQQRINEVANLAVALELYLGDQNTFKTKANEEFNGQTILIPKTYIKRLSMILHTELNGGKQ